MKHKTKITIDGKQEAVISDGKHQGMRRINVKHHKDVCIL